MKPRRYSSEGIILARRNYSEADRILVVYTKQFGKLHLIAKGVRKPKSRKRGHLEIFSQINFSAARGKNLDIMTEVEIINSFESVRKNLKRVALSYYIMEVIGKITKEEQKNAELYAHVLKSLNSLKTEKALKKFRRDFVYQTLVLLGYWPKGAVLENPDYELENVIERQLTSVRVGKKILS